MRNNRPIQIHEFLWEWPAEPASAAVRLLTRSPEPPPAPSVMAQLRRLASISGVAGYVLGLPNLQTGAVAPAGCVVPTDPDDEGVVTPGLVGHNINAGARLVSTHIPAGRAGPGKTELVAVARERLRALYDGVCPLTPRDLDALLIQGARWAVEQGYGFPEDLDTAEEQGQLTGADPLAAAPATVLRGGARLAWPQSAGTRVELAAVEEILDTSTAAAFGLFPGALAIWIEAGSGDFGAQVCRDFSRRMTRAAARHGIWAPHRALAGAPVHSHEGREYLAAMGAAANLAFARRQLLMSLVRQTLGQTLKVSHAELGARLIWDQSHRLARIEFTRSGPAPKRFCVIRRDALRALPPGDKRLPAPYQAYGQPILIPEKRGSTLYVCVTCAGGPATLQSSASFDPGVYSSTADFEAVASMEERYGLLRRVAILKLIGSLGPQA